MRSDRDIARWRLRSQHLVAPHVPAAADVVSALLAVQAENPSQSAWAVAARTSTPDAADLARSLGRGEVIRTHVLRPTWHYVAADDAAWLTQLTAPRVRKSTLLQLRTGHDLDDVAIDRLSTAVLEALGSAELTRTDLADRLAGAGYDVPGPTLMILLADLRRTVPRTPSAR